ncbi:hypothetical protein Taro_016369, partial [Colocasia esculenta]|nr:hypothetical protein [Colocasia esculenta]
MGRGSGVFYGCGSTSIRRGGLLQRCSPRRFRARVAGVFPSSCTALVVLLVSSALVMLLLRKAGDVALRTKTVAGHNLEPTPWHLFPPKEDAVSGGKAESFSRASRILRCSYLTCPASSSFWVATSSSSSLSSRCRKNKGTPNGKTQQRQCPPFFLSIHRDLDPWRQSRISAFTLAAAKEHAAMRVLIVGGRLYVDLYYACVQSRAMFTLWGLLQLLQRYPGMVPDVDLMFDCMDRPAVLRSDYESGDSAGSRWPPPPLFRYCTTKDHFDIPFPDWSFWGWPEINVEPWDEEFKSIKLGSQARPWALKHDVAYWKGNPDVDSPIRMELLNCNDSKVWGAKILRQNWVEEAKSGFQESKLSNQCNHRYKIYAEGYAWSVSLKYIISCGSLALLIDPQYEDFFSRGLIPRENYWPISRANLCKSIKSTVLWGNAHPTE